MTRRPRCPQPALLRLPSSHDPFRRHAGRPRYHSLRQWKRSSRRFSAPNLHERDSRRRHRLAARRELTKE